MQVQLITFFKSDSNINRGIFNSLQKLDVPIKNFVKKHPNFESDPSISQDYSKKFIKYLQSIFSSDDPPDLLVIDEINIALFDGIVKKSNFLDLLDDRPENMDIVMTGRNAPPKLLEKAHLISKIVEEKHYYKRGVKARKGIEF